MPSSRRRGNRSGGAEVAGAMVIAAPRVDAGLAGGAHSRQPTATSTAAAQATSMARIHVNPVSLPAPRPWIRAIGQQA